MLQRHSPIKLTALSVTAGTVPLLLIATPAFLNTDWSSVDPAAWLGVLYCGGLAIALGYVMWNRGVQQVGAACTAVYSNLTPVLVALIAWLVRGDPLTVYHLVGAIIILTGITLTRLGRRPCVCREVCRVLVGGTDVCLAQLQAGMAWYFRRYAKELPPDRREQYADAEAQANAARRRLWADAEPVPPWAWRRRRTSAAFRDGLVPSSGWPITSRLCGGECCWRGGCVDAVA
jgi:uncharacterized membrane protein